MSRIKEDTAKILILGDSQVGKSSILSRYRGQGFSENMVTTVGTDFVVKRISLPNHENIKLQIWDTAGQERFRCITKNYYRDTHGLLLVFDVTNAETFKGVEAWLRNLSEEMGEDANVVRYLVGNKIDLPRVVSTSEALQVAARFNVPYYETSAKTGAKIDDVFNSLAKDVYTKVIKKLKDSILDGDPKAIEAVNRTTIGEASGRTDEEKKKCCS